MRVNAATAACRCLPFKVLMPILNMLCLVSAHIVSNSTAPRKSAAKNCWPKFKTGILERSKLESFGRSKLDTRPPVYVDADPLTFQALFIAHPIVIPKSISRLFGQCSDVWPDSSPDPSLRESQPSPRRSQQSVTSHSPPRNPPHQAKPPRRRAIPPLLSCDCRLQPSPPNACQKRYFARMRGTTGFVGSGLVSRT